MSVFVSDETGAGHLRMNMKIAVPLCSGHNCWASFSLASVPFGAMTASDCEKCHQKHVSFCRKIGDQNGSSGPKASH